MLKFFIIGLAKMLDEVVQSFFDLGNAVIEELCKEPEKAEDGHHCRCPCHRHHRRSRKNRRRAR